MYFDIHFKNFVKTSEQNEQQSFIDCCVISKNIKQV